ncbi:cyclin-D1-binding protein 1 homolog isoform X2 [Neocloeon triangulifer]|uniref:cyclin-D1-binding protein 1 homolog isoform X2 n=1 Tax=Neocloeon triangulifer TaxID=2078957 RepID=UPI00286EEF18|nr:cyclin-D1-binding protein 1 homolog isoform X2 [Neocloeon triangulifer]
MAAGGQSLPGVFQALLDHLQFIYEKFKENKGETVPPGFTLEEFWTKLSDGGKLLSHETTKTSMAFSKPPLPNVMEAQGIATALDAACMNLATVAASLPAERGAILFSEVQNATLAVFKALVPVILSIRDKIEKGAEERLPMTGSVWEACEQLGSLPKNNLQAVNKQLQKDELLVMDALLEVEEELRRAGHGECQDAGILDAGIGLVKTARAVARRIAFTVRFNGDCNSPEHVTQLDQIATQMARISPGVDDFVTTLYPPVDKQAASQTAGALFHCLQSNLLLIRSSHCAGEGGELVAQWVNFLLGASNHNAGKVLAFCAGSAPPPSNPPPT